MPRYVKQVRKTDCGVVAYVNVLKWAKIPVSYEKRCEYDRIVNHVIGVGTYRNDLIKAIRTHPLSVFVRNTNSIKDLDTYLERGKAAILQYRHSGGFKVPEVWHFGLVIQKKYGKYETVNVHSSSLDFYPKKSKAWINKELMNNLLKGSQKNLMIVLGIK